MALTSRARVREISIDGDNHFCHSRMMETKQALDALSALAQADRLEVFRLLVRQGPIGLPAGKIAEALDIAPSTLSPHLAQLERAGICSARPTSPRANRFRNDPRCQRRTESIGCCSSARATRRAASWPSARCIAGAAADSKHSAPAAIPS